MRQGGGKRSRMGRGLFIGRCVARQERKVNRGRFHPRMSSDIFRRPSADINGALHVQGPHSIDAGPDIQRNPLREVDGNTSGRRPGSTAFAALDLAVYGFDRSIDHAFWGPQSRAGKVRGVDWPEVGAGFIRSRRDGRSGHRTSLASRPAASRRLCLGDLIEGDKYEGYAGGTSSQVAPTGAWAIWLRLARFGEVQAQFYILHHKHTSDSDGFGNLSNYLPSASRIAGSAASLVVNCMCPRAGSTVTATSGLAAWIAGA
jgi:hypothetical protein